ncbi:MAG: hypothetical protein HYV52_01825 [Parcubacteria group bacterium]|nr:hypothetical protein [Parcubacteria group bacterium]
MEIQKGAKIGLISRIDYGSQGFRQSLVDNGFNIFRKIEGTHFNILVGGLVSEQDMKQNMKKYVKTKIDAEKNKKKTGEKRDDFYENLTREQLLSKKFTLEEEFLKDVAEKLSKVFPVIKVVDPEDPNKEKVIDLFIVTSPAFDGEIGEKIAQFLSEIRSDIRIWNSGGDKFVVKYVDKTVWVLTPTKAVWMRGDYYSTPIERVIKDKIKQTSQQGSPDFYIVGCFGSSVHKQKGELKYQYVSVPVCHRLEKTRVNENQIGVSVFDVIDDSGKYLFRTYNLKDIVSQELSFVIPPQGASSIQKKIIENIKSRGWTTPGILKHNLGFTEKVINNELEGLKKKKTFRRNGENWPGIFYQEKSKKYYFNLDYVQHRLKYAMPAPPFDEDRIISFACFHAGSVETDYNFFLVDLPKIILNRGVKILIDAGDTKEGMKHNLDRKGELIAGINNTKQEKFAANSIGIVIFKVFVERFSSLYAKADINKLTQEKIDNLISDSLLLFIYILGNHDLWETEDGHDPLELFHVLLARFLTDHIWQYLNSKQIKTSYESILKITEKKIMRKEIFELPSGLKMSIQHPHMARAKTTSLRPQEMLEFGKRQNCQITIGANFHVSESLNEWDMDLGQCHSQEIGTIKHGSNFERRKMKIVDQGVGYLRVLSKDKKIYMTESAFDGAPRKQPIDNIDIINSYITKEFQIEPLNKIE